jgi:hypothetical protein
MVVYVNNLLHNSLNFEDRANKIDSGAILYVAIKKIHNMHSIQVINNLKKY